jgi:hypothetical protein
MPKQKRLVKKSAVLKQAKKTKKKPVARKTSAKSGKTKSTTKPETKQATTDNLIADGLTKKRQAEIKAEFKKYAPDLEPQSGKTAEWCARTVMTLAHHGTPEAIEALQKFKSDSRAPGWIDCAIEECEMILWDDTVGRQISEAEECLRRVAEKVMEEKLIWDKDTITGALKEVLKNNNVNFSYGKTVKLLYKNKVIGEDQAEFIIDGVLLVGIKPGFADWLIRFRKGREGKDLRKGDLENIEQGTLFNEDGEKLIEPLTLDKSFNNFYEQQFYNILRMSDCYIGYLLDFSGAKIYGKFFSKPYKNGVEFGNCSGWCPDCLEELKCETAQEFRVSEDKRRYRILKRLMQEIVELEDKMLNTGQPAADLRYQIEIAESIKKETENKLKEEEAESRKKELLREIKDWDIELTVLHDLEKLKRPDVEDRKRLERLRQMYEKIKSEVETEEYKIDVEGLEVYYSKAEPSSEENAASYHDPLCDCDEYDPLSMDKYAYPGDESAEENKINFENIPF